MEFNKPIEWSTVLVVLHGSKIITILKNILISIKQKWYAYMYFYIAVDE